MRRAGHHTCSRRLPGRGHCRPSHLCSDGSERPLSGQQTHTRWHKEKGGKAGGRPRPPPRGAHRPAPPASHLVTSHLVAVVHVRQEPGLPRLLKLPVPVLLGPAGKARTAGWGGGPQGQARAASAVGQRGQGPARACGWAGGPGARGDPAAAGPGFPLPCTAEAPWTHAPCRRHSGAGEGSAVPPGGLAGFCGSQATWEAKHNQEANRPRTARLQPGGLGPRPATLPGRPRPLTRRGSPGPAGPPSAGPGGPPPADASAPVSCVPSSAASPGPSSPPGTALGAAQGPRTVLLPESQGDPTCQGVRKGAHGRSPAPWTPW